MYCKYIYRVAILQVVGPTYRKCCALSLCHYIPVVAVLIEVEDGALLVVSDEAMLVGVCLCVAVVVGVVGGVPLVGGGDVAASEGVGPSVGSTTLVLLAVLSPVGK